MSVQRIKKHILFGLNCNGNFRITDTGGDELGMEGKIKNVYTDKTWGFR